MTKPDDKLVLKPCPFCGSEMESLHGAFGHVRGHPNCPIYYTAFDDAEAGDWNTRASMEEEIAELRAEMERRDESERRHCLNWGPCSRMDAALNRKPPEPQEQPE